MFTHAICRRPGQDLGAGLTTSDLGAPDHALALVQHDAYIAALRGLGLKVDVLGAKAGYPDAHFVEDTAVVIPEVGVICRPGHPARRGEEQSIAPALTGYRPLEHITAPGLLDGGDVLQVGRHFFVGVSERTNREGAEQLGGILKRHGYTWTAVPVGAGLHFKSSVNEVGGQLLVTSAFANRPELTDYERIVVPGGEEYAANTLRINNHLLVPAGFSATLGKLTDLGMEITTLELSEMRKMDGGLTCLSLRF